MALLDVENLNVRIPTEDGVIHAVRDVSFSVDAGEFFGVVGESGSGKSVLVQAIMGLIPNAVTTGRALFNGKDLLTASPAELQKIRGNDISMIFQDPLSSLHPQFTVGWQITEQIRAHEKVSKAAAFDRAVELLRKVDIPNAKERFNAYPHQFSGGMRQRVMIAMALSLNPALIIADEPTTALDSTVQMQILDLLNDLRSEFTATVLMITHDLGVLARFADRMMVMYAGHRLESGPSAALFRDPIHPYSAGLLRSSPMNYEPGTALVPIPGRPPSLLRQERGCVFADRCPDVTALCHATPPPLRIYDNGLQASCWLEQRPSVPELALATDDLQQDSAADDAAPIVTLENVELSFRNKRARTDAKVLNGIDLTIHPGETLGLVGESGCGKSTLARVIAGLIPASSGEVTLFGRPLSKTSHKQWRELRADVQLVFQDPYGSLNPRRRVGAIIGDPFRIHGTASGEQRKQRVQELMELVGLNPEHYNRLPAQFSGGQRQRIGIARALALKPSLIICDEPVSALDVSVQAQVLNLLAKLQREFNLTYLFISHDLSVVRHICSRIAVMDQGRIIELQSAQELYSNPQQEFTKRLLAASSPVLPEARSEWPRLIQTIGHAKAGVQ